MRPSSAFSFESNRDLNPPTSYQFAVSYSALQIRYSSSGDFVRCTLEDFDEGGHWPPNANGMHASQSTKGDTPGGETGETEGNTSDDGPRILGRYSVGASQDRDIQEENEILRIRLGGASNGNKITTTPPNPYKLVQPSDYYQFMDDLKRSPPKETGPSSLRLSEDMLFAQKKKRDFQVFAYPRKFHWVQHHSTRQSSLG